MAFNISYIYKVIDKVTPAIEKIKQSMDSVTEKAKTVSKEFKKVSKEIEKFGKEAKKLGKGTALYISAPLSVAGGFALKASADIEKMQTSFISMLGSKEKAAQMMKTLQDISGTSPFDLSMLNESTRQLIAFGVPVSDAVNKLKMLSDIAAGSQQPLSDIAYIYGRIQAYGAAYSYDLYQIIGRGIPIMKELKSMSKLSEQKLFEMASKGQISARVIDEALARTTRAGGMFFHKTKYMAETLSGALKQLKNNFYIAAGAAGDQINKAIGLTEKVNFLSQGFKKLAEGIKTFAQEHPLLTKFLVWAGLSIIAISALAATIGLIALAISTVFNPIALAIAAIVAAISGLITVFIMVGKTVKGLKPIFDLVFGYIMEKINAVIGFFGKIGKFLGFGGGNISANVGLNNNLQIPTAALPMSDKSEVVIKQYIYDPARSINNTQITTTGPVGFDMGTNMAMTGYA